MTLVSRNREFYDVLQEEKVPLSEASNVMIDRVSEFLTKKAVTGYMNIIKDR